MKSQWTVEVDEMAREISNLYQKVESNGLKNIKYKKIIEYLKDYKQD